MKIIEAINRIDSLKHNTYTQPEKIAWLSTLDAMAKAHVIDTHEGGENVAFNGYDQNTDLNTVLLIPAPYEEAYLKWLEAQIDYANGEYDKYNNAIESFNTFWNGYKNYYNRTHMPLRNHVRFFGGHPKPSPGSPQVNQAAIERILTKIGDMNKLNTENKETLVAAINEALRGGADREEIKRIVDEYLKEHGTGGTVKTVNGIAPDENGNVQIPVSGGNADQSGGTGMTDTARALLISILRNAVFTTDQSASITALNAELAKTTSGDNPGGSTGGGDDSGETETTTYTVVNNLENVENSNTAANIVEGSPYIATLTGTGDYAISSITVTMGGVDITATAWDAATGNITIAAVTGDIIITASGRLVRTEVLEMVRCSNYPNVTTFEYTEGSGYYTLAKRGTIQGGLVTVDFDTTKCVGWNLNFYVFDADGNPYKQTDNDSTFGETNTIKWEEVGAGVGFGLVNAPFTVQMEEGCTFIASMRKSNGTSADGSITTNQLFNQWAESGGITITVTG